MKSFGGYVKAKRTAAGYSIRAVASKIGKQNSYLSKVERGDKPPPSEETIVKLAAVLDEDPDILLALAGKVPTELREIFQRRPRIIAALLLNAESASDNEIRQSSAELRDKWEDVDAWCRAVYHKTALLLEELRYGADLSSRDSMDDLLGIEHSKGDRHNFQLQAQEQLRDILQDVSYICSDLVLGGNVSLARSLPSVIDTLSFASRRFNAGHADLLDTAHNKTVRINLFAEYLYWGYIWNNGQGHPCLWVGSKDKPEISDWESWRPIIRRELNNFTEKDPRKLTVFKHVLEYAYPGEPSYQMRDEQTGKLRKALLKDAPDDKIWNRIMDKLHTGWKNMSNKQASFANTGSS